MKVQAPTSKLQRNFNNPSSKHEARRLLWMLKVEASLDVGAWNLEFPIVRALQR
ncbi:MAG: hypothetical protein QOG67_2710 [Verrucomicrobiota bacterium]